MFNRGVEAKVGECLLEMFRGKLVKDLKCAKVCCDWLKIASPLAGLIRSARPYNISVLLLRKNY